MIGVEIVRPGEAAAQCQDAVRRRKRLVSAQAEFAAGVGCTLGVVAQRELIAAGDRLLGVSRQAEGGELACRIGRDANTLRDEAIAAFETPRPGIGFELGVQPINAGGRHGPVGRDVLPAIGQCAGQVCRPDFVTDEGAGLEQVGVAAADGNNNITPGSPRVFRLSATAKF